MASSVSSERTFSAAGITISKRRSRLKADIVKALECSDAVVRFRTKVRTRTFQNRTEVRFKVQTIAGPDRKSSPAFEQEGKVPNLFELGPNRTL